MHADAGLSNYQCLPPRGWNEAAKGIDLDVMDRSTHTHPRCSTESRTHSGPGLDHVYPRRRRNGNHVNVSMGQPTRPRRRGPTVLIFICNVRERETDDDRCEA